MRERKSGDRCWALRDLSNARWRLRRLARATGEGYEPGPLTEEEKATVARVVGLLNEASGLVRSLP